MTLREAKKVKIKDKVVVKETDQVLTVANKTFYLAGVGYYSNTMVFEFDETDKRYTHQGLKLYSE